MVINNHSVFTQLRKSDTLELTTIHHISINTHKGHSFKYLQFQPLGLGCTVFIEDSQGAGLRDTPYGQDQGWRQLCGGRRLSLEGRFLPANVRNVDVGLSVHLRTLTFLHSHLFILFLIIKHFLPQKMGSSDFNPC